MSEITLSKESVKCILEHYAAHGGKMVPTLAKRYGVSEYYIKQLAMTHGVKAPSKRGGTNTHADPRWLWAEQRGHVIA